MSSHTFYAQLERFEERFAVLRNDTMGEFRWPMNNLPPGAQIGDKIAVTISTDQSSAADEGEEKYARMRRLLEELIN